MRLLLRLYLIFLLSEAAPLVKKNAIFVDYGGAGENGVEVLIEKKGKPSLDELPQNQEEDVDAENLTPPSKPSDEESQQLLQSFGFIKPGALSGRSDEDEEDAISDAIKKYQKTMGILETGVLDDETKEKLAAPHCGEQAVANFVEGADRIRKWRSKTDLTYSIRKYTGQLDKDTIREAIRQAFAAWAAVSPITFREVSSNEDADIKIGFMTGDHGDGSSFDGPHKVVGHGFYPEAGMLHFDDDEKWVDGDVRLLEPHVGVDLFEVALHEIGHVLGIDHNQNNRDAIMFPSTHPNIHGGVYNRPQLTADDIGAVQKLYGLKKEQESGNRPTSGGGNAGGREGGGARRRAKRIAWHHGPWNSYYAFGCGLYGRDIYNFYVGEDIYQCANACYDTEDCFAWARLANGNCLLKGKFEVGEARAMNDRQMICGAWF